MSFTVDIWARKGDQVSSVASRTYTPPEPDPGGGDADYKVSSLAAARALDPQIGESVYVDHVGYYDVVDATGLEYQIIDGYTLLVPDVDTEEIESSHAISAVGGQVFQSNILFNSMKLETPNGVVIRDIILHGAYAFGNNTSTPWVNLETGNTRNTNDRFRSALRLLDDSTFSASYARATSSRRLALRNATEFDAMRMGAPTFSNEINGGHWFNWLSYLASIHPTCKTVFFSDTLSYRGPLMMRSGVTYRGVHDRPTIKAMGDNKVAEYRYVGEKSLDVQIETTLRIDQPTLTIEPNWSGGGFDTFWHHGNALENTLLWEQPDQYPMGGHDEQGENFRNAPIWTLFDVGNQSNKSLHPVPNNIILKGVNKFEESWGHAWHQGAGGRAFCVYEDGAELHIGAPGAFKDRVHGSYGISGHHKRLVATRYGTNLMFYRGWFRADELAYINGEAVPNVPGHSSWDRLFLEDRGVSNPDEAPFDDLRIGHFDVDFRGTNVIRFTNATGVLDFGGGTIYMSRARRFLSNGSQSGIIGPESGGLLFVCDPSEEFYLTYSTRSFGGGLLTFRNIKVIGNTRGTILRPNEDSSFLQKVRITNCDFEGWNTHIGMFRLDLAADTVGNDIVIEDSILPGDRDITARSGQSTVSGLLDPDGDLSRNHVIIRNSKLMTTATSWDNGPTDRLWNQWVTLENCVNANGDSVPDRVALSRVA